MTAGSSVAESLGDERDPERPGCSRRRRRAAGRRPPRPTAGRRGSGPPTACRWWAARSRVPSALTRTISRPPASAIHTPSAADRVNGPVAGRERREHAAVVGAEPEDHVVGDDRDPHRVPVHREVGDRAVQRRDGRDPVRRRVDPDDPAVLGARHPDVVVGEDHGRRGQRGREAVLHRPGPGVDAHRLGRAGHPDGARSERDAGGTALGSPVAPRRDGEPPRDRAGRSVEPPRARRRRPRSPRRPRRPSRCRPA